MRVRLVAAGFLIAAACFAQEDTSEKEQSDLDTALAEAGTSPVEFVRALEKHLAKYPKSSRKAEIERTIVKKAVELKDDRRILLYGERVLEAEPDNILVLERVTRALLNSPGKENAERALKHALGFEKILRYVAESQEPGGGRSQARLRDEVKAGLGRAFGFQARAKGNLGKLDEAVALARKSFETYPTAEAARETGNWLERQNKSDEAIRAYADAFTLTDPRATETDRATARARMGELYRKTHQSEKGLGDVVLEAYDRNAALMEQRRAAARKEDPNSQVTDPMQFTLSGLNGAKLELSSLRGKVVILDFWATWCGPCRVQHPLYEEVKVRFKDRTDVVFLSVNADENRAAVEPFLQENGWTNPVYFEDGLLSALYVSSFPTTVIFNKRGEVAGRMNGFIPERFVDMLTDRIRQTLSE